MRCGGSVLVQPLPCEESDHQVGNLDVVEVSERKVRVTADADVRQVHQCCVAAVLSGHVIGQLAGVTVAPYIRSKQLVPLLVDRLPDRYNYFVYFGSRSSQTARARAFINLAVKRLVDNTEYVLSSKELRMESRRDGIRTKYLKSRKSAIVG